MKKNQALKTIAKSAGIVFAGMIISKFLTYLYRMIIARYLGAESYGVLSLGFAILGIVTSLSSLGLASGVTRYVSYYIGKEDPSKIKGTITSTLKMIVPTTVIFGILLFIFSEILSIKLFNNPQLTPILKIFSFLVPVVVIGFVFEKVIDAFKRINYRVYIRNIWESALQVSLTLIILLLGFKINAVAVAYLITIIISAILLGIIVEIKIFPLFRSNIISTKLYKELLSYSWPLIFVSFFQSVTNYVDSLFIGAFISAYFVGLYNVALPTAMLILIMPTALTSLFVPVTAEMYARNNKNLIHMAYKNICRWTVMSNLPICLLLIFFSSTILRMLFGNEYMAAGTAMIILAIGYFIYSLFFSSVYLIQAFKRTKLIFANTVIALIINIILNITLIPAYGINGAAAATAVSFSILGILAAIQVYLNHNMQPLSIEILKLFFAGATAILSLKLLSRYILTGDIILNLSIKLCIFIGIYVLMLFLLRCFQKEDKVIFQAFLKKIGLRWR